MPPKKKQKTGDGGTPRINAKMTLAQLKEEAKARMLDLKKIPKLKAELLHHLVDGSIHVFESPEYKAYLALLEKVKSQQEDLAESSCQKKVEAEAKKEEQRQKRIKREEQKREKERQEQAAVRKQEIARQKSLHTHSFPNVHNCQLAKTCQLTLHGKPRGEVCSCNLCKNRHGSGCYFSSGPIGETAVCSCNKCDWDICKTCFDKENKSEEEKAQIRAEEARIRAEERRRQEEEAERWEKEQAQ